MYQLLECGLAAALSFANQGTILDITYAFHWRSPRHVYSRHRQRGGTRLLKRRDADTSAAPHSSKLPATPFIRAALKIIAHSEIVWNKTRTRKFTTIRRRMNVCAKWKP